MRALALALCLVAGCKVAAQLEATAAQLERTGKALETVARDTSDVLPKVGHLADTLDEAAHGSADITGEIASWLVEARPYVLGAIFLGGPWLLTWLWKKRKAKRLAKP